MGRYSSNGSYSQQIRRMGADWFRISWVVDRYCKGSRLRFPTSYSRDTDHAGAVRFAKKWDLAKPESDPPTRNDT